MSVHTNPIRGRQNLLPSTHRSSGAVSQPRGNYGPRGMSRPISLRLMPEERAEIEKIARHEGRAVSPTCRMLCLKGLQVYLKERAEMECHCSSQDR